MSRIRSFQLLVIISAIFYLVWFLLPYTQRNFPPHIQDLLDWGGYGSIAFTQHPLFYLSIGAAKLISTLGLFLFLSWGRWLLLAVVAISIAMVPFSGMAVAPPLDSFVGSLAALTDGAILALAFYPLQKVCGEMSKLTPRSSSLPLVAGTRRKRRAPYLKR